MQKVAFIGLGVMGYPMAGHLASAGYDVCVFNRTPGKAASWIEQHRGRSAATPALAAADAAVVFACVGNDDDVRAVTTGSEGAFTTMGPGTIFVDHTTASAQVARELAEAADKRSIGFIDAPVSGGQIGAQKGTLTVMCGGVPSIFTQVESVIASYARCVRLLGPSGSGQLAKMVNQISIAGLLQSLAEGLHFAQRAGLDPHAVIEVLSQGAAQSWQMENRHQTMIEGRFDMGFAVDLVRKDLAIALDEARRNGARLPVAALVDQFYGDVQRMGGGRWDTSSLIARLDGVKAQ